VEWDWENLQHSLIALVRRCTHYCCSLVQLWRAARHFAPHVLSTGYHTEVRVTFPQEYATISVMCASSELFSAIESHSDTVRAATTMSWRDAPTTMQLSASVCCPASGSWAGAKCFNEQGFLQSHFHSQASEVGA
jgi:hypothetical protein